MIASMTADCRTQESVFAFLMDPAIHPRVHRIDTHAASVFLEGNRALKVKRAVRFPYLDYSTLERRKAACDEEIRINVRSRRKSITAWFRSRKTPMDRLRSTAKARR